MTKHSIPLSKAVAMTTRYRENKHTFFADSLNVNALPNSETFDAAAFEYLLSAPGCKNIRIYYGISDDYLLHAVVVAADIAGKDILPEKDYHFEYSVSQPTVKNDWLDDFMILILDNGQLCPPATNCPHSSLLNSSNKNNNINYFGPETLNPSEIVNPKTKHNIPLSKAVAMTTRYRENKGAIFSDVRNIDALPDSETFDANAFRQLVATPGCKKIRLYYGMLEDNLLHTVIVAADAAGKDILPDMEYYLGDTVPSSAVKDDWSDDFMILILDNGQLCPPACNNVAPSLLNTRYVGNNFINNTPETNQLLESVIR